MHCHVCLVFPESKIKDGIRECRAAVEQGNGPILALRAKTLAGQAERVAEVARAEMTSCDDPVVRQQLRDAALQIDEGSLKCCGYHGHAASRCCVSEMFSANLDQVYALLLQSYLIL